MLDDRTAEAIAVRTTAHHVVFQSLGLHTKDGGGGDVSLGAHPGIEVRLVQGRVGREVDVATGIKFEVF